MASWDDGYVTDVGYTDHFHRETTPAWLAMAALLLGYRPPDLAKPFRYADLGCGNGLTALIVAATTPQAEVWAFDFNPAHIEAGRTMAAAAGLTNIRFEEASFAQIAAMPDDALPPFDFVVAHGVLTWLSPENTKLRHLLYGRQPNICPLIYRVAESSKEVDILHIRHAARRPFKGTLLQRA